MKKFFFAFFLLTIFFSPNLNAAENSGLRISLLTCSPGDELYSLFGHSALRVVDSVALTDIVYNYGTFNFDDPDFYIKFASGKLLYYLSVQYFVDFKESYEYEKRTIYEQVLNFSDEKKLQIRKFLNENLKEENKYYHYDFFLDNCTTRLRDIIAPAASLPAVMPLNTTYRMAIHKYLNAGKSYWSKLGIDLLLGLPTDAVMTASQQQFLPDNLFLALKASKKPIVKSETNLTEVFPLYAHQMLISPGLLFTLLLIATVFLTWKKSPILIQVDRLLFFITGLLGLIILLMWFVTDHSMTKNNLNILWAWPTHLIAFIFISKQSKFFKIYFGIYTLAMAILLLSWQWLPQQLNVALIPLIVTLGLRSAINYLK